MNIGRSQNQFVNGYDAGSKMILGLRLVEMQLSEFFDLKDLTEGNQEIVLSKLTIM